MFLAAAHQIVTDNSSNAILQMQSNQIYTQILNSESRNTKEGVNTTGLDVKSVNQILSSRHYDQRILNVEIKNLGGDENNGNSRNNSFIHSKSSKKSTSRQTGRSRLVSAKTYSANNKSPFLYNKNLCSVIGNQFVLKQNQPDNNVGPADETDPGLSTLNNNQSLSSHQKHEGLGVGRTIIYSQQQQRNKAASIQNQEVKYVPAQLTTLEFDKDEGQKNDQFNFHTNASTLHYSSQKKKTSRNLNQSVTHYKKQQNSNRISMDQNHSYFNHNPQSAQHVYGTNKNLKSLLKDHGRTESSNVAYSRNIVAQNITSSFIKPAFNSNQEDPNNNNFSMTSQSDVSQQQQQPSLLMKMLNLKELNTKQSFHLNKDNAQLERQEEENTTEEKDINNSMGRFFQKRSRQSNVRNSGKNQFDGINSQQDYGNSRPQTHLLDNGGSTTLLSHIARRKDYQSQQRQNMVKELGIQNQIYLFQPISSGSQSHATATQYGNKKNEQSQISIHFKKTNKNPYKVREQKFERLYKDKLQEIRQDQALTDMNIKSQQESQVILTKVGQKSAVNFPKKPDIAMYKERNDQYKILSNRIKIRSNMQERRYVDKNNIKILEKFFDPLRIRLRVQPIGRAPQTIGKNADFYFIEAGKLSLKGDLPKAIELLKRGLELKPNHYLCLFNHGVVLFKLGLILEAKQDFESILASHPNDTLTAYNLAICYVQIGNYQHASDLCTLTLEYEKNDKTLIYDAYKLRGICLFRLGKIQESIRNYNQANRIKQERDEQIATIDSIEEIQEQQLNRRKELEYTYINLFIEETRIIFDDPKFKKQVLKGSRSVPALNFIIKDLGNYFQRFASERNSNVRSQKDHSMIKKQSKTPVPEISPKFGISPNQDMHPVEELSDGDNKVSNLSPKQKQELSKLKSFVGNVDSPQSKAEKQQLKTINKLEKIYYEQMKDDLRVSVDGPNNQHLRFDKLYSQEQNSTTLNDHEKTELDKRKKLEHSILQTIEQEPEEIVARKNQDKLLEMILNSGNELTILMREVEGSQNKSSLSQVRKRQEVLADMLEKLRRKFYEKQQEWEQDFAKEIAKYSKEILMIGEDLILSAGDIEDGNKQLNSRSRKQLINKVSVIQKLQESLKDANITPHDVQNILIRDREERQRAEILKRYQKSKSIKRLSLMQMVYIKEEFSKVNEPRDLKMLDSALKSLKFFRRFDQDTRQKIYRDAQYFSLSGHKVIFNQGDIGDKLYIILKGRVAVQINSVEYGRLPVVISTLNDGDQFGELSLIQVKKLQDYSNKQGEVHKSDFLDKEDFNQRRKATCLTVEDCDFLVLSKEFIHELYQPELINNPLSNRINQHLDLKQDELNGKIAFLQSCQLFRDVDAQYLMPIACNMLPVSYSFGEYILKEGDIPKGLYLIKSGQCKAAAARVADRQIKGNYDLNKKLGDRMKISDKQHPLFHEYDPDNTLLNEVKSMSKGFQNNRIYVDEKGEQIRDKIVYQDIMTFQQLMPRNAFGGRVLLPYDMYINLRRIYCGDDSIKRIYPKHVPQIIQQHETEEEYQLKSLLSIIADSGVVEVYILDKTDMSYIPDHILKHIFEEIAKEKEPDRPFSWDIIEEKKEEFINWEQFKVKCVQQMFIRRLQESNFQKASR